MRSLATAKQFERHLKSAKRRRTLRKRQLSLDMCKAMPCTWRMIKSFRSKGLAELWSKGRTKLIGERWQRRALDRLALLDRADNVREIDAAGLRLHALKGHAPVRYSIWVTGAWRITFEFEDGHAYRVDLEQYH